MSEPEPRPVEALTQSQPRPVEAPAVPKALAWVAALVVLVGAILVIAGSLRVGVTTDEPYHVEKLNNYFDHGWYAMSEAFEVEGGVAGPNANTLVYGPVATLVLHGLTVLVGAESWGHVEVTASAYQARHFGTALLGLVGVWAAAGIARRLLGSWGWGLIAAAALCALPMWTGHAMFNIKDIPVATGYTLVTWALVAMVLPRSGGHWSRGAWFRIAVLAAGLTLAIGTRPAMWAPLFVSFFVVGLGAALGWRIDQQRPAWREIAVGVVVSGVLLIAIYPQVFAHPDLVLRAVFRSSDFTDSIGSMRSYTPVYYLGQTPFLLQGLAVIGTLAALVAVGRRALRPSAMVVAYVLVGAQFLLLFINAIVTRPNLYTALRQLLSYAPGFAVVVAIGAAVLLAWARPGRLRALATAGVALALVVPTLNQVLMQPFQYNYFNLVGPRLADHYGLRVEPDYWRASFPELADDLPEDGPVVCDPRVDAATRIAQRRSQYARDTGDCRTTPGSKIEPWWTAAGRPAHNTLPADEFYIALRSRFRTPTNCTRLHEVTRRSLERRLVFTYAAQCSDASLPDDTDDTAATTSP